MEKMDMSELLRQQRISLLHHAHIEAMKQIIERQQPFTLSVSGALSFRELAKSKMEECEYNDLMSIMYQYKDTSSPNVLGVLTNIYNILKNYPEAKQAFGMFLPPDINLKFQTGYYGTADKTESPESGIEIKPNSVNSLNSTKSNFSPKPQNVSSQYASTFLIKVEQRFENDEEGYKNFLQLLPSLNDSLNSNPKLETEIFVGVCDLFQDHEDLIEEFKPFVPNADYSYQNRIISDASLPPIENASDAEDNDDLSEYNEVKDPSIADVYKYGTYEEHLFFDKVKKALVYKEVYDNFLRCLNLYNEDIVTNVELVKVCTSFLGRHPELLKELKDMLGFEENGENYEIIPMKIVNMENSRCDPELALDIDYATDGRNGASYRALSKDHIQPECSGRTSLCKEVLNDIWVSFPSWSEDSTFVTSCKTQYEEIMYRSEDERFEPPMDEHNGLLAMFNPYPPILSYIYSNSSDVNFNQMDMAIQSNAYTIQLLDNVQKRINKMNPDEKTTFSLDDTLGGNSTVLYQRALHRLYGDKLEELLVGLKRNPVVAVPIILKRLRGKEEEWKEKQREFHNHWRLQIDNFYLKSLDHQGINFKQNDCKNFRSKNLLKEMEMVYSEKKENEDFNTNDPHFLLEFKDMTVFMDALNLMSQYLKKLPGVYRNDRSRIEYLIRRFIPDFFGVPQATTTAEEDNASDIDSVEEIVEKMDIDNQCEERSGNTSPSENGICSKDDVLSDQEGLNSADENEMSDASDKSSSFIEEIDIFDKMEPLLPIVKNLPYVLFFVNKTWFVFFRQFHILCERLSRLLFEGLKKDVALKKNQDKSVDSKQKPTYIELIEKLSQLLSGAIDYTQFEEDCRSLFGIHAFVSFTMDKLVSCIVRQLQQVVTDDICKQCTSLFFTHTKIISESPYISLLERSHIEAEYLRKVEPEMNEENCFQVVWHKEDLSLTIQLIEKECDESVPDPCETEKWSHYLENYVASDTISEEILSEVEGLPVFLPRNLRRQHEYWRRKVALVESLWKTRHSSSFLKKNSPYSLKRKAALLARSLQTRTNRQSTKPVEIVKEVVPEENINTEDVDNQFSESKLPNEDEEDNKESSLDDKETKHQVFLIDINNEQNKEELVLGGDGAVVDYVDVLTDPGECTVTSEETPQKEVVPSSPSAPQDIVEDDVSAQIKLESERASHVIEAASHVIGTISVEDATEEICTEAQDKSLSEKECEVDIEKETKGDKDDAETKEVEVVKPKERRPMLESVSRPRKRLAGSYIRRRAKRQRTAQSIREKRKKQIKADEFEDILFDYAYFSALSEDDKYTYLALKSLTTVDNTEVSFRKGNYKMFFVQNCDTYIYRKNSLMKSKEHHQQISEIKTSNFNYWHRIWMDRYVTPEMIKSCNSWILKSDPGQFKVVRITVNDCKKSPYIPYNKYKLKYYKIEVEE